MEESVWDRDCEHMSSADDGDESHGEEQTALC